MEVERELKRYGKGFSEVQKTEIVTAIANRIGLNDADDLYNNIGYGGLTISKIAMKLRDEFDRLLNPDSGNQQSKQQPKKATRIYSDSQSVIIDDVDNCEVKYAKCCNPIPGDTIIGFITKGHGVSIHKFDCEKAQNGMNDPEQASRWIAASWNDNAVSREKHLGNYDAVISVCAYYSNTILSDITLALTDMNVAVTSINVRRTSDRCIIEAVMKCSNVDHLQSIVGGLKRLKNVTDVVRGII